MPSPVTHCLVGAALAQAAPAGASRWKTAVVLGCLAILPDIDLAAFSLGIPYSHSLGHRGLTHSLIFAFAVGAAVGWAAISFRGRGFRSASAAAALAFAALTSHGFLDAATNGGLGVGLLIPLNPDRFFLPLRPILVSPFDPASFLERSFSILRSEATWVWLPVAVLSGAFQTARLAVRRYRRPGWLGNLKAGR